MGPATTSENSRKLAHVLGEGARARVHVVTEDWLEASAWTGRPLPALDLKLAAVEPSRSPRQYTQFPENVVGQVWLKLSVSKSSDIVGSPTSTSFFFLPQACTPCYRLADKTCRTAQLAKRVLRRSRFAPQCGEHTNLAAEAPRPPLSDVTPVNATAATRQRDLADVRQTPAPLITGPSIAGSLGHAPKPQWVLAAAPSNTPASSLSCQTPWTVQTCSLQWQQSEDLALSGASMQSAPNSWALFPQSNSANNETRSTTSGPGSFALPVELLAISLTQLNVQQSSQTPRAETAVIASPWAPRNTTHSSAAGLALDSCIGHANAATSKVAHTDPEDDACTPSSHCATARGSAAKGDWAPAVINSMEQHASDRLCSGHTKSASYLGALLAQLPAQVQDWNQSYLWQAHASSQGHKGDHKTSSEPCAGSVASASSPDERPDGGPDQECKGVVWNPKANGYGPACSIPQVSKAAELSNQPQMPEPNCCSKTHEEDRAILAASAGCHASIAKGAQHCNAGFTQTASQRPQRKAANPGALHTAQPLKEYAANGDEESCSEILTQSSESYGQIALGTLEAGYNTRSVFAGFRMVLDPSMPAAEADRYVFRKNQRIQVLQQLQHNTHMTEAGFKDRLSGRLTCLAYIL